MVNIIKLYDLILEILKEEILERLNRFNTGGYPDVNKRIETEFKTYINNSVFIGDKNLIISSINENSETHYCIGINNMDISEKSYYIYNYCGHSNDWIIHEFKSLEKAEEYLLKEFDNIFTTSLLVFKNLKRIKYEVKGREVVWTNKN